MGHPELTSETANQLIITPDSEYYTGPQNIFHTELRDTPTGLSAADIIPTTVEMRVVAAAPAVFPRPEQPEAPAATNAETPAELPVTLVSIGPVAGEIPAVSVTDLPPMETDAPEPKGKFRKPHGSGRQSYRSQHHRRGRGGKGAVAAESIEAATDMPEQPAETAQAAEVTRSAKPESAAVKGKNSALFYTSGEMPAVSNSLAASLLAKAEALGIDTSESQVVAAPQETPKTTQTSQIPGRPKRASQQKRQVAEAGPVQVPTVESEEVLAARFKAALAAPAPVAVAEPVASGAPAAEPAKATETLRAIPPVPTTGYVDDGAARLFTGEHTTTFVIDTDPFIPKVPNAQPPAKRASAVVRADAPRKPDFSQPAPVARTERAASTAEEDPTEEFAVQDDGTVLPVKHRFGRFMEKAGDLSRGAYARVTTIGMEKKDPDTYIERSQSRQKWVRRAIGAALVGKVAWSTWAAYRGLSAGGHSAGIAERLADQAPSGGTSAAAEQAGTTPAAGPTGAETAPTPTPAPVETPAPAAPAPEVPAAPVKHALTAGENPWSVARQYLVDQGNAAPTIDQINVADQQILAASGVSEPQAGSLPVGFELTMPGPAVGTPQEAVAAAASTHPLAAGENPWEVARQTLIERGNAAPSTPQISDMTQQILAASGVSEPQAGSLPVGFELKVPDVPAPEASSVPEPAPSPAPASTPPLTSESAPLNPARPNQAQEASYWESYWNDYAPSDGIFAASLLAVGGLHYGVEKKLQNRHRAEIAARESAASQPAKANTRPGGSTKKASPSKPAARPKGSSKYGTHGKSQVK